MCLQKQAPFSPDLPLIFQTPPVYWQKTRHPVDEEGDRGPRTCVHLAREAHDDKGRPSASQRRGPTVLRGASRAPWGTSHSEAQKAASAPVSPRGGGADTTFCKHLFFIQQGSWSQIISVGPWKAVPKRQPAGPRAKWGANVCPSWMSGLRPRRPTGALGVSPRSDCQAQGKGTLKALT